MIYLVRSVIFLLAVVLPSSCSPPDSKKNTRTQETSAKEVVRQEITFDCGYGCSMDDWMKAGVPWNQSEGNSPAWAFFYFRVNGSGEVDKLYHRGNLSNKVADIIGQNIRKTEGHWVIPEGFALSDHWWFVLPYFDLGKTPCFLGTDCTKEDSLLQQTLIRMEGNMHDLQRSVADSSARIFPPISIGGGAIRM